MDRSYFQGVNERILNRIPPTASRILEIGCAEGRLCQAFKNFAAKQPSNPASNEWWGIELNPQAATQAKTKLNHVVVGDVEQMDPIPVPERYFDCLICGDVLEHLRDPQLVMQRLRKHLAPGATVIVNVPNIAHWSIVLGLLQGNFAYADNGLLDRTHLRFFTPTSLREMLWEAGYLVTDGDALEVEMRDPSAPLRYSAPLREIRKTIASAAQTLGIDPGNAEKNASIYQQLYVAKPVPDPYNEPDKMAALVGPHIGKLGPASKRASVIVLTYNSMGTIENCLNSVLPTLRPDDELILVDNASSDGTPEYLERFSEQVRSGHLPFTIYHLPNEENLGFSRGCNVGILRSNGEFIILLNPDTIVYPGWIEGLIAPFADEKIGAVGPLSDNVCGDQFVGLHVPNAVLTSRDSVVAYVMSKEPSNLATQQPSNTKLLIGFCMALNRKTLDKFGLLEERCFLGADDLEISWRLRCLAHELAIATDVFVSHQSGQSFANLKSGEKERLVAMSDRALIGKLRNFYGSDLLPTSMELWGNPIFEIALSRG